MNSPHALARHLATYITDKSAIASYVGREFGRQYKVADIERMLRGRETDSKPRIPKVAEPIGPNPVISTNTRGPDPLALALFKYHAKRANGADRRYWEARL